MLLSTINAEVSLSGSTIGLETGPELGPVLSQFSVLKQSSLFTDEGEWLKFEAVEPHGVRVEDFCEIAEVFALKIQRALEPQRALEKYEHCRRNAPWSNDSRCYELPACADAPFSDQLCHLYMDALFEPSLAYSRYEQLLKSPAFDQASAFWFYSTLSLGDKSIGTGNYVLNSSFLQVAIELELFDSSRAEETFRQLMSGPFFSAEEGIWEGRLGCDGFSLGGGACSIPEQTTALWLAKKLGIDYPGKSIEQLLESGFCDPETGLWYNSNGRSNLAMRVINSQANLAKILLDCEALQQELQTFKGEGLMLPSLKSF